MLRKSCNVLLTLSSLSFVLLATIEPASAHPGAIGHGFLAGVAHPLTGLDHLLIILAVGAWAAALGSRSSAVLPFTFLGAMAIGAVSAHLGFAIVGMESLILASIIGIGLAMTMTWRSLAMVNLLVGASAFMHGFAHGTEMPATADAATYFAGFLMTTIGILLLGATGTWALRRANLSNYSRTCGLLLAFTGALMATG